MKKGDWQTHVQILMTLCALWGWWGMLYPEFTLTEDTYRVVYETVDAEQSDSAEKISAVGQNGADAGSVEESPRELYRRLLHAPKGQVRFRSKLLMQLQKWMEQ